MMIDIIGAHDTISNKLQLSIDIDLLAVEANMIEFRQPDATNRNGTQLQQFQIQVLLSSIVNIVCVTDCK